MEIGWIAALIGGLLALIIGLLQLFFPQIIPWANENSR